MTQKHVQKAVEAMAWPYTSDWFARHARLTAARQDHNLRLALTHLAQRLTTLPAGLPYRKGLNYIRGATRGHESPGAAGVAGRCASGTARGRGAPVLVCGPGAPVSPLQSLTGRGSTPCRGFETETGSSRGAGAG